MPDTIVRPIGYVEDEAIIRQIGDRDLYLGNKYAADPEYHDRSFKFVLSVSTDNYPLTTHHHPLDDGPENDWLAFERAVDTARTLYRREGPVLIHCTAGISRSSTLIATTIAAEETRHFRDALSTVQHARPCATPHPSLHELGIIYLSGHM